MRQNMLMEKLNASLLPVSKATVNYVKSNSNTRYIFCCHVKYDDENHLGNTSHYVVRTKCGSRRVKEQERCLGLKIKTTDTFLLSDILKFRKFQEDYQSKYPNSLCRPKCKDNNTVEFYDCIYMIAERNTGDLQKTFFVHNNELSDTNPIIKEIIAFHDIKQAFVEYYKENAMKVPTDVLLRITDSNVATLAPSEDNYLMPELKFIDGDTYKIYP